MLLVNRDGKGTKKVPLSRCVTPDTGWEVIKLSTRGSELYDTIGHKKCQRLKLANYLACIKCYALQRCRFLLKQQKKSGDFLFLRFQPYYRYYSNGINSFVS